MIPNNSTAACKFKILSGLFKQAEADPTTQSFTDVRANIPAHEYSSEYFLFAFKAASKALFNHKTLYLLSQTREVYRAAPSRMSFAQLLELLPLWSQNFRENFQQMLHVRSCGSLKPPFKMLIVSNCIFKRFRRQAASFVDEFSRNSSTTGKFI